MNHRCCRRHAVDLRAKIRLRDARAITVRITNLSRGGAYVETPGANLFAIDSVVEIRIPAGTPDAGSDTVVQGMVIHRGANGLGVMFLDENTHAVTDLCNRHALHRSTPPVRRAELGAIPV